MGSACIALAAFHAWRGELDLRRAASVVTHRSSRLDLQLLVGRQLLQAIGWLPALGGGWWLATHTVRRLDAWVGAPALDPPTWVAVLVYSAVLFVAWDLSRYVVHRLMHAVPVLWEFHQVHHSAEVLTPLTFHRVHPVESVLYALRGGLVTGAVAGVGFWVFRDAAVEWTLAGVSGVGLLLNAATGNLRHSHAWLRFPGPIERWLISPAQHQLHHTATRERRNFGTWLAVWDRLGGTLDLAPAAPPESFGVPAAERNHGDDLLSAWLGPFRGALRVLWPLGVLLVPCTSWSQDAAPATDGEASPVAEHDAAVLEILVKDEGGKPRVAGSAHVVDEETLEQFEYDDIHDVLEGVPGVYVRGEDGFGLRPNIGIRGANSDRSAKITLLEDGVLLAPAPYAAPAAYYFPMTTRLVGVEVFKGPAATTHGPQTVGGAINLLTRRTPRQPDGSIDLSYGLRQTAKVHGWVGTGGPRWGVLVEGVHLQTDGFKELDGGGETGFERSEWMAKARFGSDPARVVHHAVELKLGYASEVSYETYLGLHIDDFATDPYRRYAASQQGLMQWKRTQVEVAWPVSLGALHLRTVAYHHGLVRSWTKFNRFAAGPDVHDLLQQQASGASEVFLAILRGDEDSANDDQTLLIGTNDRRYAAAGVQTRAVLHFEGVIRQDLEAGVRVHLDRVDRLHTEDPFQMRSGSLVADGGPTDVLIDSRAGALALATHVHDDLQWRGLHVLPGARLESITSARDDSDEGSVRRDILLPGLGLLAELTPALDVFAGAHRGFSPVPPGEPEEVKPEVSWNVEAGARAGRIESFHGEFVLFLNDYANLTGQCTISGGCLGDDLDRQFNGGRVAVYGAEAVLGHDVLLPARMSVPIEGTYTFTETRFQTGFASGYPQFGVVDAGDSLPYVPRHSGSLRVSVAHPRARVSASLSGRSGMLDEAGQLPVSPEGVPGLVTLDLALDGQLTPLLALYGTVTNVTGATGPVSWRPFGARPVAPLQAAIGVRLRPQSRDGVSDSP